MNLMKCTVKSKPIYYKPKFKIMPYINDKITDFQINEVSRNYYKVTYTSPTNGKQWSKETDDKELIKNIQEEKALISNLRKLKFICKL